MPWKGCFQNGSTFSDSVDVPVPADALWEVVIDLDSLPEVVTMVSGFEVVSGNPPAVGTRFREKRVHKGKEYTMFKTVTRLDESDPQERSFSLGIFTKNPDGTDNDVVNTSTLICKPVDENNSTLILLVAFQWDSFWGQLHDFCCRCCIRSMVRRYMSVELEDYRTAAMQRYEKK